MNVNAVRYPYDLRHLPGAQHAVPLPVSGSGAPTLRLLGCYGTDVRAKPVTVA